jgi:hypothetical protein
MTRDLWPFCQPALSAQAALVVRGETRSNRHEGVLITTGAIRAAPPTAGILRPVMWRARGSGR